MTMWSIVLGIDIGITGAIAVVNANGALIRVEDMPCLADGPAGRRTVNAPLLAKIIFDSHADHAFVEHVAARPGEGAVGAFAFGRCRGVVEGVLGAAGLPCSFMTPSTWKGTVGLARATKDAARSLAIRKWPGHAGMFARIKDDGRAEAALIAISGLVRSRQ